MGVVSRLKNLIRPQGIPKLIELASILPKFYTYDSIKINDTTMQGIISIIAFITRFGGPDGTDLMLGDDPENSDAFGHMVVYGYLLIIIVQILGLVVVEEDEYNYTFEVEKNSLSVSINS